VPGETYTHGHDGAVLRSHRWRTAENSAPHLLGELRPGLDLLDVGCGPGTITVDLARRVAPGRVVAIDAAPAAVDAAASAAAEAGVAIDARVGDAYALDLPDAAVDVVHAHQVLQHLADPVAALREWRRVTRPGGIVAVRDADYAGMHWWPPEPRLARWLELYEAAARANGGEPDAGRRVRSWALAAGFTDVRAGASCWVFADPDDRAWWSQTWAERVTGTALGQQLVEGGLATADDLADIAEGWRAWAAADDAWFCVPHGEVLARA
jgi:SAM-dependent methyltransferase